MTIMTDEEFKKELKTLEKRIKEHREKFDADYNSRTHFLVGWVTSETAPIHTPAQLEQIFELAK